MESKSPHPKGSLYSVDQGIAAEVMMHDIQGNPHLGFLEHLIWGDALLGPIAML